MIHCHRNKSGTRIVYLARRRRGTCETLMLIYLGYTEAESASMRIQQSYILLHNDVYVI